VALSFPAMTSAGPLLIGSGLNPETGNVVSGQAEFSVSGNFLTVTLTNTTAGGTLAQGDSLTGVVFDVDGGSPTLSLTSIVLTGGSTIHTSASAINNAAALSGSWTTALSSGAAYDFGVATTGFNGLFQAGTITRGNSSANYGLIATGTSLAHGFPKFPYIENSLTFTFSGALGLTDSQFDNVKLLFGTDGTGLINAPPPEPEVNIHSTPEPGTLALAAMGGVGLCFAARRRKLQK